MLCKKVARIRKPKVELRAVIEAEALKIGWFCLAMRNGKQSIRGCVSYPSNAPQRLQRAIEVYR